MKVCFTPLCPSPDPVHGSPIARSSHGLSLLQPNSDVRLLVLHGGESIARTPLPPDQSTWIAERRGKTDDDEGAGGWKWRLIIPSPGSPSPSPRVAHAQASVGDDKVYVFGGRAGIEMGEMASNELWCLDCSGGPGSETWTEVRPADAGGDDPPEPRSFHRMVSIGTDLYVFGGCGKSGRLNDLHKFDTLARTWRSLGTSKVLRGRGGPNLILLKGGNALAIVAGFAGEETNDGHRYMLGEGRWEEEEMEGLKEVRPRSVCVSGSLFPSSVGGTTGDNGVCIIFGGEVDPSDRGHEGAGGFENDVVVLDGTTGEWRETLRPPSGSESSWPERRGWSDGAAKGSSLFFFGGLSGDDKNPRRLDDLWRCDVEN